MNDSGLLLQFLVVSPLLIVSLVLHELAHGWVAYRLGDPTAKAHGRLTLNPIKHLDTWGTIMLAVTFLGSGGSFFFGWAKPVPVDPRHLRHPKRDFALIAAAGPASNLIMATIGAILFAMIPHPAPGDIAARAVISPLFTLVVEFVQLNVLLAVFNMIPVPPLDGGNVLLGVLPHAGARVVEQLRPYGFLILYALMLTGTLGYLLGPVAYSILRVLLRIP